MARAKSSTPRDIRQPITEWEPGAHLYATFGSHWKAGAASLIPFGVIYFTAQPLGSAIQSIAMGGYTIAPAVVGIFATGWAGMSYGLLALLRHERRVSVHYAVWTMTGAAVLLAVALGLLTVVTWASVGFVNPTEHQSWNTMLWAAPLLGGLGSFIGRFVLRRYVSWHVWIQRKPLPDAFTFVEGKRDKNDFERM
jgi:hypothetical protein